MGYAAGFTYASAAEVFDELRGAWNPKTGYDIRGVSHDRLRAQPMQWPCAPDGPDRNPQRYLNSGASQQPFVATDGTVPRLAFATESGRAAFLPRPHLDPAELPDGDFPFVLNTGRLQHQWHTMTKTGKIPTLNKLNPGPFVEIHPTDASRLGIANDDGVKIASRRGAAILPAVVTDRVRPGTCFAPFHWNDLFGSNLAINAVTNDAVDPVSLQPELKICAVALVRVGSVKPTEMARPGAQTVLAPQRLSPYPAPDWAHVDSFAAVLGLEPPAYTLSQPEMLYLQGYLAGLRSDDTRALGGVPVLPATAPFTPDTRLVVEGLLAGLFARAWLPEPARVPPTGSDQNHGPILVLWASQTGTAEAVAETLAARLKAAGHPVVIQSMNKAAPRDLIGATVLLLASTFGDGDPPTMRPHSGPISAPIRPTGCRKPVLPFWRSAIPTIPSFAGLAAVWMPGCRPWARRLWLGWWRVNPIMTTPRLAG